MGRLLEKKGPIKKIMTCVEHGKYIATLFGKKNPHFELFFQSVFKLGPILRFLKIEKFKVHCEGTLTF